MCILRNNQTHFLHLSHALLTLVLSLSSRRRLAGGDRCSLEPAFEGVVAEVAAPSARSLVRFAATHDEGLTPASEGACGGLMPSIAKEDQSIRDVEVDTRSHSPKSAGTEKRVGVARDIALRISAALFISIDFAGHALTTIFI